MDWQCPAVESYLLRPSDWSAIVRLLNDGRIDDGHVRRGREMAGEQHGD